MLLAADQLLGQRRHRQRRRAFRLVVDGDVGQFARTRGASDHTCQVLARFHIGIDQLVERLVLRLGRFVAVGAVAAVQVPPTHQRAGPQRAQQRQLVFDGRHLGVQAEAIGHWVAAGLTRGAQGAGQQRGVRGAEESGVAHFQRDHAVGRGGRQPGQGGQQGTDAVDERGHVGQQRARQRADLEHQCADLVTQALQRRLDEFLHRQIGVQKRRVRRHAAPVFGAHQGVAHQSRRFDNEAEPGRHLRGVLRVLAGGERAVERAIQADGAEQRVLAVGRQPFLRQLAFSVVARPHQPGPAGKVPRGGAQPKARRQAGGQCDQFGRGRRGQHGGGPTGARAWRRRHGGWFVGQRRSRRVGVFEQGVLNRGRCRHVGDQKQVWRLSGKRRQL